MFSGGGAHDGYGFHRPYKQTRIPVTHPPDARQVDKLFGEICFYSRGVLKRLPSAAALEHRKTFFLFKEAPKSSVQMAD